MQWDPPLSISRFHVCTLSLTKTHTIVHCFSWIPVLHWALILTWLVLCCIEWWFSLVHLVCAKKLGDAKCKKTYAFKWWVSCCFGLELGLFEIFTFMVGHWKTMKFRGIQLEEEDGEWEWFRVGAEMTLPKKLLALNNCGNNGNSNNANMPLVTCIWWEWWAVVAGCSTLVSWWVGVLWPSSSSLGAVAFLSSQACPCDTASQAPLGVQSNCFGLLTCLVTVFMQL